jgi:hypothetical protein
MTARPPALALAIAAALAATAAAGTADPDAAQVAKLNENYFRSWVEYDMDWYRRNLAEDFVLIAGDGKLYDKQAFVSFPRNENIGTAHIEDVKVRVYASSTAVVTANTVVDWKDGRRTATRYTDVYAKVNGQWKAVSAQLTADKHFAP